MTLCHNNFFMLRTGTCMTLCHNNFFMLRTGAAGDVMRVSVPSLILRFIFPVQYTVYLVLQYFISFIPYHHNATMLRCYNAMMLQCYNAYNAAILQYKVITLQCYHAYRVVQHSRVDIACCIVFFVDNMGLTTECLGRRGTNSTFSWDTTWD
jgi:hypothetical protein